MIYLRNSSDVTQRINAADYGKADATSAPTWRSPRVGNSADANHTVQMPIGVAVRGDIAKANGWNVRPQLDVSVIPQFGDTKQKTRLTGPTGAADSVSNVFAGKFGVAVNLGVQADKGNFTVGVRYGFAGGNKGKADHVLKVEVRLRFQPADYFYGTGESRHFPPFEAFE